MVSSVRHAGTRPVVLISPSVGFRPTVFVNAAGMRPEPAVSVPSAKLTRPVATAHDEQNQLINSQHACNHKHEHSHAHTSNAAAGAGSAGHVLGAERVARYAE